MIKRNIKFFHTPHKKCLTFEEKKVQDLLLKWGLNELDIQTYNFDKEFHPQNKEKFINLFFCDPEVYSTLTFNKKPLGKAPVIITVENVPCDTLSMGFFNRLLNPENNIVKCDQNSLVKCTEKYVEGFRIIDNLRNTILNEGYKNYKLYSASEREQFLWKIFTHLCLGGVWCYEEATISPYLNVTKKLYKELVSVGKISDSNELVISSTVLRVQLYEAANSPLAPFEHLGNPQDFLYLVINAFDRSVAVLSHCYR